MFPPSVCELLKRSTIKSMWSEPLALAISAQCPNHIAELVRITSLQPTSESAKNLHMLLLHVAGRSSSLTEIIGAAGRVLAVKPAKLPDLEPDHRLLEAVTVTGNDISFGDGVPVRGRPTYVMDGANKSQESSVNRCHKSHSAITSRTGGVFSFFCRHGFCYGCD